MKIIKDIERKVKCVDQSFDLKMAPSIKKVILDSLHMDRKDGEDAIRATKLGLIIYDKEKDLELEDADFEYIKKKVSANPAGYPNFALGDVLISMNGNE